MFYWSEIWGALYIDNDGVKAITFLLENNFVKDVFEAIENYEENVRIHEDSSMEDIAYNLIEECYSFKNIPDIIANNIDYEKIGRDLKIEGSYCKVDRDIYEYIG